MWYKTKDNNEELRHFYLVPFEFFRRTVSNMEEQSSLESEFNKQESTNTEKFVMTEPLKRCKECGELKPYSEFYKHKECKSNLNPVCKECQSKRSKEYYKDHREEKLLYCKIHYSDFEERIKVGSFLNRKGRRVSPGYFNGQGICLICGEIYPLFLENHHVIKKDDMVVSLCSNCHRKNLTKPVEKHMIAVLNAIENSKFLWDSDGQPKGLKLVPMWTADLPLKEAIKILKSYDLPGYEPIGVEV